jgi:hypothetical protein
MKNKNENVTVEELYINDNSTKASPVQPMILMV